MRIISHRGNIKGPIIDKENSPSYIDAALQLGYDVEIDMHYINDEFFLGHDYAQYKVNLKWLLLRKNNLWIHCKDKDSASKLIQLNEGFKIFCHTNDDYVLTSTNHLWVHNLLCNIDETTIIPLINLSDIEKYHSGIPYGICTDYVTKINKINFNVK
jgi:hypothetical protein